ncbi:hypothetical protein BD410DRAFT_787464 [Rickenella mellea]|uniref:F-box domain-containing protein n=1 Tax=Rickenella mellea TaxID=50990 RepID=A0A4Y7Q758_9AGAM|nr:hypothetical protein BD410DRAFT_787464 [Rickenella mellea]
MDSQSVDNVESPSTSAMAHDAMISSPAQSLIPDLLAEIFSYTLPSDPSNFHLLPRLSTSGTPFVLGGICRAWRNVALNEPNLWSCFEIPREFTNAGVLREWTRRSQTHPLSFTWMLDIHTFRQNLSPVSAILVANVYRWRHVRVRVPSQICEQFTAALLKDAQLAAPELETLHLETHGERLGMYTDTLEFDLSPGFPRLSRLALEGNYKLSLGGGVFGQLRNVTLICKNGYHLQTMSLDNCFGLLATCPNLEILVCGIVDEEFTPPEVGLVHSALQSMNLEFPPHESSVEAPDFGAFLDSLTLPSLHDLSLLMRGEIEIPPWAQVKTFIERSCAPLKSLRLQGPMEYDGEPETAESQLVECLRLTPELQNLLLDTIEPRDVLLHALTLSSPDTVCPSLRKLTVYGGHLSRDAVKAMVVSRLEKENNTLQTVILRTCHLGKFHDAQISGYMANGFEFEAY